jgi:hypothetical protein
VSPGSGAEPPVRHVDRTSDDRRHVNPGVSRDRSQDFSHPPSRSLANKLKPGSVAHINQPPFPKISAPFKKMENIANFLKAIRSLGMRENEMFSTPDLYEEKNVRQVVDSMHALGRLLQDIMPDAPWPKLGIKIVAKNVSLGLEGAGRQGPQWDARNIVVHFVVLCPPHALAHILAPSTTSPPLFLPFVFFFPRPPCRSATSPRSS